MCTVNGAEMITASQTTPTTLESLQSPACFVTRNSLIKKQKKHVEWRTNIIVIIMLTSKKTFFLFSGKRTCMWKCVTSR